MLTDYEDKFYIPMSRRFHRLSDNHYALAAQIAEWKRKVSREWDSVQVDGLILPDKSKQIISLGKSYQGKVVLDLGELSIDDIGVELVAMMKRTKRLRFVSLRICTRLFREIKGYPQVLFFRG